MQGQNNYDNGPISQSQQLCFARRKLDKIDTSFFGKELQRFLECFVKKLIKSLVETFCKKKKKKKKRKKKHC